MKVVVLNLLIQFFFPSDEVIFTSDYIFIANAFDGFNSILSNLFA